MNVTVGTIYSGVPDARVRFIYLEDRKQNEFKDHDEFLASHRIRGLKCMTEFIGRSCVTPNSLPTDMPGPDDSCAASDPCD